ncbi:SNF2-related protein [Mycoplasma sp. CR]|uniref:SNF2-related protein n=1 Tax=Mycoplasma sp. CR TaxID=3401693 RepID=UPI003AB00E4B
MAQISIIYSEEDDTVIIKGDESSIFRITHDIEYKKNFINKNTIKTEMNDRILFSFHDLGVFKIRNILKLITKICSNLNFNIEISDNLHDKILNTEKFIKEKTNLGKDIKNIKNFKNNEFSQEHINEKYFEFKKVLEENIKRPLNQSQLEDAFFHFIIQRSGNYSVPGSGKTATALGTFYYLYKKGIVNRMIVISPVNAFLSWKDEIKALFYEKNLEPYVLRGTNNYSCAQMGAHVITILNFEKVNISNVYYELNRLVDEKTFIVIDESHKIKNPNGKIASHIVKLIENKEPTFVLFLTGTPVPNSYQDLYNPTRIFFGHDNLQHYFNYTPEQLRGSKNIDKPNVVRIIQDVNEKIYPFFVRTSKEDLNIPAANEIMLLETKASEQETALANNISNTFSKSHFVGYIRLMQLESNPELLKEKIDQDDIKNYFLLDEDDNFQEIDSEKIFDKELNGLTNSSKFYELIKLVKRLVIEEKKKIIIWCIFKKTINKICNYLIDELNINASYIDGSTKPEEREIILKKFQKGIGDVLITNPHTLAESVSLHQHCHDAIYYELSYNLVHYQQSKNRIHRLGIKQDQYTQYYVVSQFYEDNSTEDYNLMKITLERLLEKEEVQHKAVEERRLETRTFSTREDIETILSRFFKKQNN